MTEDIERLQSLRLKIAALGQSLAERELTGRIIRLETEAGLRTQNAGLSASQAEKLARTDPLYLAHERRSIELSYDRSVAEAEAEAVRFRLLLAVEDRAVA